MKNEGTVGAATILAIAAVVGVSLQGGPKQSESGRTTQNVESKRAEPSTRNNPAHKEKTGCSGLLGKLEDFLALDDLRSPQECFEPDAAPLDEHPEVLRQETSGLKFVIALMPDPIHTHSSSMFDQFAAVIQEGAQDEQYDFDSAWLPWDDEESPHPLLADEKLAGLEKEFQESQPGVILFRRKLLCDDKTETNCKEEAADRYRKGLLVFVVGEDATRGIHKEQFRNALAWIASLEARSDKQVKSLAILGPTFSGSFPSLAQELTDHETVKYLDLNSAGDGQKFTVYSGSVSSDEAAHGFQNTFRGQVVFHSFVQGDDEILGRFCTYMEAEQHGFDPSRVAIISEDETAYGGAVREKSSSDTCLNEALKLYYPRDISALRGAYQTKSLFAVGASSQPADTQSRNLPTDLADPTRHVHDSIRSYGGNRTPLAQEAYLMEIVGALRELHARYVILRSSNMLDQLFLANFLRRSYPDGRIVILGSDLMFIRERGSTGLSGAMTLSTYPLFPLERDWTEHESHPAADRTFSSDTTEGTYVAFRLLLNDMIVEGQGPDAGRCHVLDPTQETLFVPPVYCDGDPPIPDYSSPFWSLKNQCGEFETTKDAPKVWNTGKACPYPGPSTWLSVIGVNRFWPMASLGPIPDDKDNAAWKTEHRDDRKDDPGGRPEVPLGMKVFLLTFAGFSLFHAWCCWFGSYTAKPIFRAHFASTGDPNHTWLIFGGSCCIAFIAIVAGWGSGVFFIPDRGLAYPWFALIWVLFAWLMAWGAILANIRTSRLLAADPDEVSHGNQSSPRMTGRDFTALSRRACVLFLAASVLFYLCFIYPIEWMLHSENRVLTYWRAMHLTNGVSPLVPIFSILIGLYLAFWFTLHGLALFGPDRPCLPKREQLALEDGEGNKKDFLRMFSREDAAASIEQAAMPFNRNIVVVVALFFALFVAAAFGLAAGIPVRSLGTQNYSVVFLIWLGICCSLCTVEAWRLYHLWDELRRLLAFLDRLPLRRTMAALRGFSWGSVWKMSGNVLEVRYKVISRQMECMNHTIATLEDFFWASDDPGIGASLAALGEMRKAGVTFADWYSRCYLTARVGDLTKFTEFQASVAAASGTLLAKVLVPAWRKEKESLLVEPAKDEKEGTAPSPPRPAEDAHIRNVEEFVCLNYLAFIQNVLGRLRTMAMTIIVLFVASACAMSSYPFDPRQALSVVLIVLFTIGSVAIVKVYADMHRDATLSHVTKTKPGELGIEFWFKLLGFGLAPLIGLVTRIFPGITDVLLSFLQPSISSFK